VKVSSRQSGAREKLQGLELGKHEIARKDFGHGLQGVGENTQRLTSFDLSVLENVGDETVKEELLNVASWGVAVECH